MDFKENYMQWLNNPNFDKQTTLELKSIENNEDEIKDRFYKDLEFGTAGLRGVIGAGTNRMNRYTVAKATLGLANYILKQEEKRKSMGVAIAYDSRHMSPEFAEYAALVLNANGIKSYVFKSLQPTPVLSFTVRELGTTAGIVITASHNPSEYNGYKVYWEDGAQVTYPKDEGIMNEVNKITDITSIKFANKDDAIKNGLFNFIGDDVVDKYLEKVKEQCLDPESIKKVSGDLKIVYTPLNGTGNIPVTRLLKELGFKHVYVVHEQEKPDSNFTTVKYPNPEDPKSFKLAIELAKKVNADIIIGTDPDADRVGAVLKDKNGEYVLISGNTMGALLTNYVLSKRKEQERMPSNGIVIKTVVTTQMINPIAEKYNVGVIDVLTGFKYIGEKIKEFELSKSNQFVFGFEESYGYLSGTYARDKDAVVASMLISELTAVLKTRGLTLFEGIEELYEEFGYYKEIVKSITLKGADGLEKMNKIMQELRNNPPKSLAGLNVSRIGDYKTKKLLYIDTKKEEDINLPISDVLKYYLKDDSWACVRPSGTEPKIKIYSGTKTDSMDKSELKVAQIEKDLLSIIKSI